jgi:hypothetical protein
MSDQIFIDGMYFEIPQNAPDFVKGKISINVAKLTKFLNDHQNNGGYVSVDVKESKTTGKVYCVLNTWKPEHKQFKEKEEKDIHVDTEVEYPEEEINPEDIPF